MSRILKIYEQTGKIGGHAVKNMIEVVEQKMAAGENVSAAPNSAAEADLLTRQKNSESAQK